MAEKTEKPNPMEKYPPSFRAKLRAVAHKDKEMAKLEKKWQDEREQEEENQ
jgi:hypothetical protein